MGKNTVRNVVVHIADNGDINAFADRLSEFHAQFIERRLNQSELTRTEKITVVDKIIEALKSREDMN